ncbi:hypothetical protein Ciccas_001972 [Cichlidogyrus casuarinus]|uniref:Uncharacterized protein n=1 Tax=Cichlidogyrus casuarinus TaxID=1844966 RepID=A0ABD2QIK5_9PLAT
MRIIVWNSGEEPSNLAILTKLTVIAASDNLATGNSLYYARFTNKIRNWRLISSRFFPRVQNYIPALKKQRTSIITKPKELAHVKNSTEALLVKNNGYLENYILSSDGCELELTRHKYDRFSEILTSLLYYAHSIKQIKSWTQIARQFFPFHFTKHKAYTGVYLRPCSNLSYLEEMKPLTAVYLQLCSSAI